MKLLKKLLGLICVISLACAISACSAWAGWWHQPLGETLVFSTAAPETATVIPEVIDQEMIIATAGNEPSEISKTTATEVPTATPELLDDEPEPMFILVAGIASDDPQYRFGLADAIRIVRVDFETPKVTVLTLPRDLWVALPGIKEDYPNLTHGKINTAYSYGTPSMNRYEGEGGGPGMLAQTIANNYNLAVDHYAIINMAVFADIVDALGGIDIYLNRTWDGRADTENPDHMAWVFEEGQHHMTGDEALRFARIRLNDTEIMRTDNQTLVLCSIKDKALQPKALTAIPDLIKAFQGRIQTDLSPAQITQLVGLLPKLSSENLVFFRFPNGMMVPGRVFDPSLNNTTFIWDIPIADVKAFINNFAQDTILIDIGGGGRQLCP